MFGNFFSDQNQQSPDPGSARSRQFNFTGPGITYQPTYQGLGGYNPGQYDPPNYTPTTSPPKAQYTAYTRYNGLSGHQGATYNTSSPTYLPQKQPFSLAAQTRPIAVDNGGSSPYQNYTQHSGYNAQVSSSNNSPHPRYAGFMPQAVPQPEYDVSASLSGSISEHKHEVQMPRLEIEGSKGSLHTMRSMDMAQANRSRATLGSVNFDLYNKGKGLASDPTSSIIGDYDRVKANQKLIEYIKLNKEDKVQRLLDRNICDLNCRGENDWSPLHFAAWISNTKILSLLLLKGADPNSKGKNNLSPLMIACKVGNKQVFDYLIRAGSRTTEKDSLGLSCLHFASQGGNKSIVDHLLEYGLDPDDRSQNGKLPEDFATQANLKDYLKEKRESKSDFFMPIFSYTFDKLKNLFSSDDERDQRPGRSSPNDFDIVSLLGMGSFGKVYLVKKKVNGQRFAMKVLNKNKIMGQNLLKYALTERKVLSYINHPFIVGLECSFQTPEKLCMILEYCSGGDLSKHLRMEKRFSEEKAKYYLCEIILALQELHARDIIYRDLKPDNVVLDSEGHCKLTDFGLSKEGVMDQTSGARSFCGSIAYLAPEMLKKSGHGKAVDWYLLGVILYEMVVGQPPYYAPTKEELFYNIEKAQLKIPPGVSPLAGSLISAVALKPKISCWKENLR